MDPQKASPRARKSLKRKTPTLGWGCFTTLSSLGIIASVITMQHYTAHFTDDPSLQGAVVSTFNGGCFFGAMGAGWLGRKRTIQSRAQKLNTPKVGCIFALWGASMQAGASNVATLLVGRIIGGISIGILSMTVPLYNTEIAPPKNRGFLVGLTQQMLGIGFIVANWVGYGCQFIDSDASWRLPLSLQLVPAFLLLLGIQFLPNSPRWLLEVDRDEEANAAVYKLHGKGNEQAAELEYQEMYHTIKAEARIRTRSLRSLVSTPAMTKRLFVAVGVQVFTQFTGINGMNIHYSSHFAAKSSILKSSTTLDPRCILVSVLKDMRLFSFKGIMFAIFGDRLSDSIGSIYGAVGPIANLFFIILLLDRVGRKKPLVFGATSFVCTFSILAAIVATNPLDSPNVNHTAQRAGIAMIFLTSVIFSLSFGPVSWVLASEVFPTHARALGTMVATCSNWAFNTMIGQVAPIGMDRVGWKFYMLFVALNLVDMIIIAVFFPETKGKTLEDMNEVFGDHITIESQDNPSVEKVEKVEHNRKEFA
ncbi:hypothetical protein C0995_008221 [Termitomyces sp. Mi166|nr:hypothetical protein C0995_008221 [Termitomyces sp. Mi166\